MSPDSGNDVGWPKIGAITDDAAEIRSGLASGDRVVVFPSDRVRDGVRIR